MKFVVEVSRRELIFAHKSTTAQLKKIKARIEKKHDGCELNFWRVEE